MAFIFIRNGTCVMLVCAEKFKLEYGQFTYTRERKHQENMSVKCLPPYSRLLYSKSGVCRGIPIFLIFAPKHRLEPPR